MNHSQTVSRSVLWPSRDLGQQFLLQQLAFGWLKLPPPLGAHLYLCKSPLFSKHPCLQDPLPHIILHSCCMRKDQAPSTKGPERKQQGIPVHGANLIWHFPLRCFSSKVGSSCQQRRLPKTTSPTASPFFSPAKRGFLRSS